MTGDEDPENIEPNRCSNKYMKIVLELEDSTVELAAARFQAIIADAVQQLFGEFGRASIQAEMMHYEESRKEAILKVSKSAELKLRNALTLYGEYAGMDCRFKVLQESCCLNGLSQNSREFNHGTNA